MYPAQCGILCYGFHDGSIPFATIIHECINKLNFNLLTSIYSINSLGEGYVLSEGGWCVLNERRVVVGTRLVFRTREGWCAKRRVVVAKKRLRLTFRAREGVVAVDGGKTPPCCTSSEGEDGAG